MVEVKHYDVRISSTDDEILLERNVSDNATTYMFDYVDDHPVITLNISITAVDINGRKSESSVVERSITGMHIPNIFSSKCIANYV